MTSNAMTADITMRVNSWLDRFSPPRQIASNPEAMQADANAILRIFIEHAPDDDWQGWFEDAMRNLEAAMTTRSWPAPGEVVRACRGAIKPSSQTGNSRTEAAIIDQMIDWHHRFGTQMPGVGRPDRTLVLIKREVLRDLREARFKGFALSPTDERTARGMPMGPAERRRHVEIMARIWGCTEMEAQVRLHDPAPQEAPDLGANRITHQIEAAE